ncbi:Cell division protein FtsW [Caldisalinibacter kiritimatiensis]|uniref:Peptidoglycan glycosyltransferase RodA n=2 Tax=Caldisalinibacter kiritimatiensis TaxID=1304284 RepID=R1CC63_9FIRM|nr:Cell division protein FtsW [Caldisalinibacter kiritimatiensis]
MPKLGKKFWKKFDFTLLITVILLNIIGIIMIKSAAPDTQHLKMQAIAFTLGIFAIVFFTFFNYETFGKLYIPIYIFSNLLLVAVLIFGFGEEQWGARSWLAIGSFTFQPSEIAKFGIIISVAKFIDKNKEQINEIGTLIKILIFAFIPVGLILMQPDYGTAFVFIFFIFIMIFTAGLDYKYVLYAAIAGIISSPALWFTLKPYQRDRILDFFNPSRDPMGSGYQVIQSKMAIGSGKIFGRGLFHGKLTQSKYIPQQHTDFIFAVIGEELGFIGGLAVLLLYFIMIYRLIKIARNAKDLFGSLIVIGIASMMIFHIFENIGMTMGLTPVTGIPLPFLSYGGTFLLANMVSIGIALSVATKKDGINF